MCQVHVHVVSRAESRYIKSRKLKANEERVEEKAAKVLAQRDEGALDQNQ